ncbi:MAG: hypothetical protein KAT68_07750 [Bacteroidales bacterium]|nr:hypothetical protein [Bacteroidales bacterium]
MFKISSTLFLVFFLFLITDTLFGQQERYRFIGVESGIDFQDCELPEFEFIRGDISSYGAGNVANDLMWYFQKWYLGIKIEIRSNNNKFGLFSGLRYTKINTSLGKFSNWSSNTDFFYLLYKQEGTTTEYLKIKEINQSSNYLGIPIEIRYLPFKTGLFRLFFKAAAEINYRLNTTSDVVFYNNAMEYYQDDVINKFDEPNNFYSTLYFSVGWKFGKDNKPNINLEASFPSFFLTDNSSGLVKPITGGGFQLNIQIPF